VLIGGIAAAVVVIALTVTLLTRRVAHDDVHSVEGYHRSIHTLETIKAHPVAYLAEAVESDSGREAGLPRERCSPGRHRPRSDERRAPIPGATPVSGRPRRSPDVRRRRISSASDRPTRFGAIATRRWSRSTIDPAGWLRRRPPWPLVIVLVVVLLW
jgi:hypothetical protein